MEQLPDEKAQAGREEDEALSMLHERVTSNDISRVVARATGIPVQNLLKGERDKLVHVRAIQPFLFFVGVSGLRTFVDGRNAPAPGCRAGPCCGGRE
jgi:hypothetical protein